MRLIDADKLRHELIMGHDLIGAKYTDMADTVKAIPIEYIEKFKKEFRAVASVKAVIEWLLENWEKENETN